MSLNGAEFVFDFAGHSDRRCLPAWLCSVVPPGVSSLVVVVWFFVGLGVFRFFWPFLSSFLPAFGGYPFLGTGHPLLPLCRPARLSLSNTRLPVVPATSFFWFGVGFAFWWFLVVLVLGALFWLVAGGRHGYNEFCFAAVNRGLPHALVDASTCNFEKDLSAPLPGCWALAHLLSALGVLPSATS